MGIPRIDHRALKLSVNDIERYLRNDIMQSVRNDIYPIIKPKTLKGGYFAVPRLVCCYIDFLGQLYVGKKDESSVSAVQYIRSILGKVNPAYQKYGGIFWFSYRHGLIHRHSPRGFKLNQGNEILWLIAKTKAALLRKGDYKHMVLKKHQFPIITRQLYLDLLSSIEIYIKMIKTSSALKLRFNTALFQLRTFDTEKEIRKRGKRYIRNSDFSYTE